MLEYTIPDNIVYDSHPDDNYVVWDTTTNKELYDPTKYGYKTQGVPLSNILKHGFVGSRYQQPLKDLTAWVACNINNLKGPQ